MISVIVPVYQAEKYLRQCLDIIQQQSYQDWECIVVDDGSTDGSAAICDEYATKDSRFKLVHQNNAGVSVARNKGLQLAQGNWITFCDADDRLHGDALEYFIDEAVEGVDMVMAGYDLVKNGQTKVFIDEEKRECIGRERALMMIYQSAWFPYQGYLWNKCYRKDLIAAHHLRFDERIYFNEDRLFVTQYLCHTTGKTVYSSKIVYDHRLHDGSAMSSLNKGYNIKFLTDMRGYAGMRKSIRSIHPSKELLALADEGILISYRQIESHLMRGGYPRWRTLGILMWKYFRILGLGSLLHDIVIPHFRSKLKY